MTLTFGTGIFWLLIACTASETIVHMVRALRRRGDGQDTALARRVAALERLVGEQGEASRVQEETIARLQEQVDFAERLLGARQDRARLS